MASPVQSMNPAIRFFEPAESDRINYTFAIIVSRFGGQWIWVRHKDRDTWELPAGHLEFGESALQAARRELFEETSALVYEIQPIISYEGELYGKEVFGRIFLSVITELGPLPAFEIREIALFDEVPKSLTYPEIQPLFFDYVLKNAVGPV